MDQRKLATVFEKLGARAPEAWASSQVHEGIPQLARFLFLRQAWRAIVNENDPSWIATAIARSNADPNEPYAGVGNALRALRGRGATDDELTDLVRGMQAELMFHFCYLLEDPGELEPEVAKMSWSLVQVDDQGRVIAPIGGLHESVLEIDPSPVRSPSMPPVARG